MTRQVDYEEYTGLSTKQLAIVGFISLAWNGLESGLAVLTWELASWPREIGLLVTTDLGNVSKAQLFENLVHLKITEPVLVQDCLDMSIFFDNLRVRRNGIVHSMVRLSPSDADPSRLVKRSAKEGRGKIKETRIDADLPTLNLLAQDISLCNEAMRQIYRKIWYLDFYKKNRGAKETTTFEEFLWSLERGSFDEIALLRTRVAELFPQRHKRGSKQRQPPPSGE